MTLLKKVLSPPYTCNISLARLEECDPDASDIVAGYRPWSVERGQSLSPGSISSAPSTGSVAIVLPETCFPRPLTVIGRHGAPGDGAPLAAGHAEAADAFTLRTDRWRKALGSGKIVSA